MSRVSVSELVAELSDRLREFDPELVLGVVDQRRDVDVLDLFTGCGGVGVGAERFGERLRLGCGSRLLSLLAIVR